jgi:predicted flavoprotein YhiN
VRLLLAECEGVEIRLECNIQALRKTATGFELSTSQGTFQGRSVVVATGGLSIPTMGATGLGYDLARQFGHTLVPTRASLVPITLTGLPLQDWDGLAGLAAPVRVTSGDQSFDHSLLITHRGLSGPAILQISNYWEIGMPLSIDWLRDSPNPRFLRKQLIERMPKRLADRLLDLLGDQHPDWLRKWPITASGTEGYRTAEVTLGGVDTDEISSQTMESKRVAGLYFIGEVLDVTGWLGGYNFQWAWASAAAAGRAAS